MFRPSLGIPLTGTVKPISSLVPAAPVGGASLSRGSPATSKKAASGQKEMLMPMAGKKPAKETAAKKPSAKPHRKSA